MSHRRCELIVKYLFVALVVATLLSTASSTKVTRSLHGTLTIRTTGDVSIVTILNPPINLFDSKLSFDLFAFLSSLDPANRTTLPPKVVIFRSADPLFFIPHLDVNNFLLPQTMEKLVVAETYSASIGLIRNLTTTTFIAEIDGKSSGPGTELTVAMDMRFAGPNVRTSTLETSFGVTAGNGEQYIGQLVNKGRALQYLLSGDAVDCKTGKRIGWYNDCFNSRKELEETVEALAHRIALRPREGLTATKVALRALDPSEAQLAADLAAVIPLFVTPEAQALFKKFLVLSENQTRSPFELGMPETLSQLFE